MTRFSSGEMTARIVKARRELGDVDLFALVLGYPWTRLGPADAVETWPQGPETWDDFADIRIFGEPGEWHAFRCGDGQWGARLWKPSDRNNELPRTFVLWGTRPSSIAPIDGWVEIREANGASLTVPVSATGLDATVLNAVEIAAMDEETGLAGIVDCALRGIRGARKKEMS